MARDVENILTARIPASLFAFQREKQEAWRFHEVGCRVLQAFEISAEGQLELIPASHYPLSSATDRLNAKPPIMSSHSPVSTKSAVEACLQHLEVF